MGKVLVTEIKERYPRTKKVIENAMKVMQRELEDSMLKVELLRDLLTMREKLDGKNPDSN